MFTFRSYLRFFFRHPSSQCYYEWNQHRFLRAATVYFKRSFYLLSVEFFSCLFRYHSILRMNEIPNLLPTNSTSFILIIQKLVDFICKIGFMFRSELTQIYPFSQKRRVQRLSNTSIRIYLWLILSRADS